MARGGDSAGGPVPWWLGRPLAPLYAAAIGWRNRRFDAGRGVVRFEMPVISVGNLSVGGTGKTPMVVHLVRELAAAGRRPCIAMRGYQRGGRGRRRGAGVRDGSVDSVLGPAGAGFSDEAAMYAELLPGVPIVAQADRTAGLHELLHSESGRGLDCIVLDDGFQHRRIARDLDIVLADASRDPFADRLLPAGWLREPVGSLSRADAVVLTHAELVDEPKVVEMERRVRGVNGHGFVSITRHGWAELRVWDPRGGGGSGEDVVRPVEWLAGRRVAAVCAIGNPRGFLAQVQRVAAAEGGGALIDQLVLPDHDKYDEHVVRQIDRMLGSSGAAALVTTEKDWAKLRRLPRGRWPIPIVRPRLQLTFSRGQEELRGMLAAAVRRQERSAAPAASS